MTSFLHPSGIGDGSSSPTRVSMSQGGQVSEARRMELERLLIRTREREPTRFCGQLSC